jgi:hypothetical protein
VESVERAFACGVGRSNKLGLVGTGELAVVVEGVLEYADDCLLERDDLGLQLIFRDCCCND